MLTFYRLGKKNQKNLSGVVPPLVRPNVKRKVTLFSSAHHPVEVLRISSDRDYRRICLRTCGFEIFDLGIFLGTKILGNIFGVA